METKPETRNANVGLILLTAAALLTIVGLAIHPEDVPDDASQMQIIRDQETAWRTSHWIGSFALPSMAVAALLLMARQSRPADSTLGGISLAGVVVFFGIATLVTLIEATVSPDAAVAGDAALFHSWRALEGGLVVPFALGIVSLSGLAFSQVRVHTRRAASGFAAVAGIGGVVGAGGIIASAFGAEGLHALEFLGLLPLLYVASLGFTIVLGRRDGKGSPARSAA